MPDDPITPPEGGEPTAPAEGLAPELAAEQAGAAGAEDDEVYEDVLLAALKKAYDEMDSTGDAVVLPPPTAGGEPVKKSIDELSMDELREALKATNSTLKEVISVSMQDREEQHAVDIWNNFLDNASPIEQELAKAAPFEVEDAEGMKEAIGRIKAQAAAAAVVIERETGIKVQQSTASLRKQYGIMSPDPMNSIIAVDEQDKKDMADGNRAAVISRRFAKLRGRE